ncbi:hypothetical protein PINS_up018372 [Pythium insidiosum]|nr:hypothetical protein PINS_up018372 [Pythium insidiosum]
MDDDGYIAREQILGATARARVPSEFLVQHVEHANPPALLLAVESLLRWGTLQDTAFLETLYPFLVRWYSWLATTQRGPLVDAERTTFRWRGRRADDGKLVANTLSSGLDDYPRASQVSDREMHVDLLCWMIKASDVLSTVAKRTGRDADVAVLARHRARYETALRTVHWDPKAQAFFDVGDHSEDGHIEDRVVVRCRNDADGQTRDVAVAMDVLQQRRESPCPRSHATFLFPLGDGAGGLKMQPVFVQRTTALQHVRHVGYVSVFPLLLQVVAPDAPELGAMLEQLSDPAHLWSPFGLRSLSTRDLFYERANAHGDNPYWRGSIWINANFLALRALHFYGVSGPAGPFQARAARAVPRAARQRRAHDPPRARAHGVSVGAVQRRRARWRAVRTRTAVPPVRGLDSARGQHHG